MVVQAPPAPPSTPESLPQDGVIEDARARQRRHRRAGIALVIAAAAAGVLIAALAGGGGGGGTGRNADGQPSGSGPGSGHSSASRAFPGAPSTQRNGYGVETDACPLAPPNRYLPARSGCVTVVRADVNGDGRPDLILVYSRLSRQHPSYGDISPSLQREFLADAAFLKLVLADGTTVATRLTQTRAAAIDTIAHVNNDPGGEIFLEVSRISSGANGVAYGYRDGRLVPAGVLLDYGGDSVSRSGFNCLPGDPPRLIQRAYELLGPTIYGWWQETNVAYTWHGPTLVQTGKRTFKRRGPVTASEMSIGGGCTAGVG